MHAQQHCCDGVRSTLPVTLLLLEDCGVSWPGAVTGCGNPCVLAHVFLYCSLALTGSTRRLSNSTGL